MSVRAQEDPLGCGQCIDAVVDDAVARWCVPEAVAMKARAATVRRFGGEPTGPGLRGRVRAYFWGAVRRIAFEGGDGTAELRARFLAAAV